MFSLDEFLEKRRRENKSLVLVTGVFDILHPEHSNFLKEAKKIADLLLIGIESDPRVKVIKGEGRPVNSQVIRKSNLEKLGIADHIFILPEQFSKKENHQSLMSGVQADFLAVSASSPFLKAKKEIIEELGGKLKIVLAHNHKISSTKIIKSWQNDPS